MIIIHHKYFSGLVLTDNVGFHDNPSECLSLLLLDSLFVENFEGTYLLTVTVMPRDAVVMVVRDCFEPQLSVGVSSGSLCHVHWLMLKVSYMCSIHSAFQKKLELH